jgi:rhodanese-related sulfurtransferase
MREMAELPPTPNGVLYLSGKLLRVYFLGGRDEEIKVNKKILLLASVGLVIIFAACTSSPEEDRREQHATATTEPVETSSSEIGVYQTLTLDEFDQILSSQSDDYTVVNVHIPYEGEIERTDLEIPYNDIDALTAALPDKDAPIILYCRSGRMSEEASLALVDLGYTQVWDVPGGMIAWQNSGRELVDKK